MRKIIFFLIFVYFFVNDGLTQNASTYFPANTGYKWYYKNTPLDSNNFPQYNLSRYRIDSFAVVAPYLGYTASIVRIKDNLLSLIQNTPYNDTNFYNFQSTNGWKFLSASVFPDSIPLPGLINFFKSMENWYSVFRFAQTVGPEYVIVSKDTTIAFDTITAPIRAKIKGKRFNDEVVSTVNGNYTAKKFALIYGLYLRVLIFEIPIIEKPDTIWLAQNVWMVKEVLPSVSINLTPVGIPINIPIPGNMYELTLPPIGVINISSEVPDDYVLFQNYPNPFNPISNIKFQISNFAFANLKVYDVLGKEVVTLVNEQLKPGTYETNWNASAFPGGIYFYQLSVNNEQIATKKMILLK